MSNLSTEMLRGAKKRIMRQKIIIIILSILLVLSTLCNIYRAEGKERTNNTPYITEGMNMVFPAKRVPVYDKYTRKNKTKGIRAHHMR